MTFEDKEVEYSAPYEGTERTTIGSLVRDNITHGNLDQVVARLILALGEGLKMPAEDIALIVNPELYDVKEVED